MKEMRLAVAWALGVIACGSTKVAMVPTSHVPLAAPELGDAQPRPLPWQPLVHPGEYALYDLKVRGMVVGEIELATGQPGLIDGTPAHYVVMRGTTAGVAELFADAEINMTAEISADPERPRTVSGSWRTVFRGREKTGAPKTKTSRGHHNPISALIGLRGWRPETGEAVSIRIDRRTELILVAQNARVRGPFRRPARRLAGIARSRKKSSAFEVWISDDRDRIPLLVRFSTRFGDVTLELVGYRRPRR
jgi:hypothetical protein